MKNRFKIQIWILNQLLTSGGLTYQELRSKWSECSLNDRKSILAKRTFETYRREIEETFDIDIICDASHNYQYRVDRINDIVNDKIKMWLLSINLNC